MGKQDLNLPGIQIPSLGLFLLSRKHLVINYCSFIVKDTWKDLDFFLSIHSFTLIVGCLEIFYFSCMYCFKEFSSGLTEVVA